MPQIDFGKALGPADAKNSPPAGETSTAIPSVDEGKPTASSPSQISRPALNRSHWTNIFFVAVALSGGLFCAFHFFNGSELMRAAMAWPRELFCFKSAAAGDSRYDIASTEQADPNDPTAAYDNRRPFGRHIADLQSPSLLTAQRSMNSSDALGIFRAPTAPLVSGLPAIPGPAVPPGTTPSPAMSGSSPLLSQVTRQFPGGDALAQSSNNRVAALQRTSQKQAAEHTVVVLKTPVTRNSKRTLLMKQAACDTQNVAESSVGGSLGHTSIASSASHSGQSSEANQAMRTVSAGKSAVSNAGRNNAAGGLGRTNGTSSLGRSERLGGMGSGFGRGGGLGGSSGGLGRAMGGGFGGPGGGRR